MTDGYGLKAEQLEPCHDRVVVRMIAPDETAGGIIIPDIVHANAAVGSKASSRDAAKGSAMKATVLAVGPLVESVVVGDVILMPPPRTLTDMGDGLFMVRDEDVSIKYHLTGAN